MKKLVLPIVLSVISFGMNAQNTNVQKETTSVVTTVKDSEGVKKIEKQVVNTEVQPVEVDATERHGKNGRDMPQVTTTPVKVTETTSVAIDGETKYVDVDHSAYYSYNGTKYQLKSSDKGYDFYNDGKSFGILRSTGTNRYMYIKNDKVSLAYFDDNGNLVVETYDKKTDTINTTIYTSVKQ